MAVTREQILAAMRRVIEPGEKLGMLQVPMSDGRYYVTPFSEEREVEDREDFIRDARDHMNRHGLMVVKKEFYETQSEPSERTGEQASA